MSHGGGGFGSVPWGSTFGLSEEEAAELPPADEPTVVEYVESHCKDGLDLLIEQYRNKPRIETLLCIYLDQVQELEDALWELLVRRGVSSAFGAQLDMLGAIVGRARGGLENEDYRAWIRAQIRANRSAGSATDILTILSLIFGDAMDYEIREWWPATLTVTLHDELVLAPSVLFAILKQAKSAGVRLLLEYTGEDELETFQFASATSPVELSTLLGFGSTRDATMGGYYAAAVE